jgi:oxygen-independent coproporphyrinogen-3 oxidase
VHVPFCPTICGFCNFEVTLRRSGAAQRYLQRLDEECARAADHVELGALRSLYLGGGTPTQLRDAELGQLLGTLLGRFGPAEEVTLEVHPATATPQRLQRWVAAGVTRLSIGAQSFDDATLRRLGRSHSAADNRAVIEAALETGATVSVDVITAVEDQDVAADLHAAAASGVHHVSAYTLTIESGTPFEHAGVTVDDAVAAAAFETAGRVLGAAGLERYEVSNHARDGRQCIHNLAYWNAEWWLGLGPGAVAHLPHADGGSVHRRNPTLDAWLEHWEPADEDRRDLLGRATDAVLSGLRRVAGVDLAVVAARTGADLAHLDRPLNDLVERGLVTRDGTQVRATSAGLLQLDAVMTALL